MSEVKAQPLVKQKNRKRAPPRLPETLTRMQTKVACFKHALLQTHTCFGLDTPAPLSAHRGLKQESAGFGSMCVSAPNKNHLGKTLKERLAVLADG